MAVFRLWILSALGSLLPLTLAFLFLGLFLAAAVGTEAVLFYRQSPLGVLFWPFIYAWREGYGSTLPTTLGTLAFLGITFAGVQALVLKWKGERAELDFLKALTIGLSLSGYAMLGALEPAAWILAMLAATGHSIRGLHRYFQVSLQTAALAWGSAVVVVAGLGWWLRDGIQFSSVALFCQATKPSAARSPTPCQRRELAERIESLRKDPYVLPEQTASYLQDERLPADLRFRIAMKKAEYDTQSMVWVGRCYRDGIGVPKNGAQARNWWEKAIRWSGDSEAKVELGLMLMEGIDVHEDKALGRDYIASVIRWSGGIPRDLMPRLEAKGLALRLPAFENGLGLVILGMDSMPLSHRRETLDRFRAACAGDPLYWPYQEIMHHWDAILNAPSVTPPLPEGSTPESLRAIPPAPQYPGGMIKSYYAGMDLDAWCGRCKTETRHRILTMTDGVPENLICCMCQSKHKFRAEKPKAEPKARPAASVRAATQSARPVTSLAAQFQRVLAEEQGGARARAYGPAVRFEEGQWLDHPSFGLGKVQKRLGKKVDVLFFDGLKTLISG